MLEVLNRHGMRTHQVLNENTLEVRIGTGPDELEMDDIEQFLHCNARSMSTSHASQRLHS